jgi:hypothetical protein
MARSRPITRLAMATTLVTAAVVLSGCTSPIGAGGDVAVSALAPAAVAQASLPNPGPTPASAPLLSPSSQPTSPQTTETESLQQIAAAIQALGTLDQAARDELLDNLAQTDPSIRPLATQQVHAGLALKSQAQAGEAERLAPEDSPEERLACFNLPAGPTTSEPPGAEPSRAQSPNKAPEAVDGWEGHLDKAIELLAAEVDESPRSDRDFAQHARLRMLHLSQGRRDEALEPIPALPPDKQEFWSEQCFGLATLLDPRRNTDPSRRSAEAKQHLEGALAKLGESCPLVVTNLAFITEVRSYGSYKPVDKYEFVPGQRVLLYAEVENFKSIETAKGFHTVTRSSYQIFDARGNRIDEHEFSPSEEYCRRPRRDFFIGCEFRLPQRIEPGRHVLQLTVADLNSQKIGQGVIEFTIKSSGD